MKRDIELSRSIINETSVGVLARRPISIAEGEGECAQTVGTTDVKNAVQLLQQEFGVPRKRKNELSTKVRAVAGPACFLAVWIRTETWKMAGKDCGRCRPATRSAHRGVVILKHETDRLP